MENNVAVLIFAKAPEPGQVKTRLIPALGAEHAALLHTALTERLIETAQQSGADYIELCCAPDAHQAFFHDCQEDFDVALGEQGGGNLGERMLRALNRVLRDYPQVIVVGADCPALTAAHLAEAARALRKADVVLVPAEDGGYTLIGAKRTHANMFDNTDWGSDSVLAQQRRNLAACGLTCHEMETLWDVDRPEDLPRLRALKPPLLFFWPSE